MRTHEWHATGQLSVPPAWTEPSRLERLAWAAGLIGEELREWLRREVERRGTAVDGNGDGPDPIYHSIYQERRVPHGNRR